MRIGHSLKAVTALEERVNKARSNNAWPVDGGEQGRVIDVLDLHPLREPLAGISLKLEQAKRVPLTGTLPDIRVVEPAIRGLCHHLDRRLCHYLCVVRVPEKLLGEVVLGAIVPHLTEHLAILNGQLGGQVENVERGHLQDVILDVAEGLGRVVIESRDPAVVRPAQRNGSEQRLIGDDDARGVSSESPDP